MFAILYVILAFLNNFLLIMVFIIRRSQNWERVKKIGYVYLSLSVPAIFSLIQAYIENKSSDFVIFISIFLIFLFLELLFDHILKIDFRSKNKWYLLVPYLLFYYAMNYGFVVMVWLINPYLGITMLGLFLIQIFVNVISHKKGNS